MPHTFRKDECRYAPGFSPGKVPRKRPHEPLPKAHEEPTKGMDVTGTGRELGLEAEEKIAEADR